MNHYTLCPQKRILDIIDCNLKTDQILIIFGTNIVLMVKFVDCGNSFTHHVLDFCAIFVLLCMICCANHCIQYCVRLSV